MFRQLRNTLEVTRPRSLARMQKSLDDLMEAVRVVRRVLKERDERDKVMELRQQRDSSMLAARLDDMQARIAELGKTIERLELRESQLRAVATTDAALEPAIGRLSAVCNEAAIIVHVAAAVDRARLERDPLPYLVVSDVFPDAFYEALVRGIPPYELFADKPRNKQQLKVPLAYGPAYSRAIWSFLADVALERAF